MQQKNDVIIVGAGLVGSLWAIFLAKRGYNVHVYERRDDMREAGFAGGRSINLAMSHRGWKALDKAGISANIQKVAIPMPGRMIHHWNGELSFQPYGKEAQAIYSVSRGGLNLALLNIADSYSNLHLHFNQRCRKVNLDKNEIHFENTHTGTLTVVQAPLIFGADGAFSAVRNSLQKVPLFNYAQTYLNYGYKELSILPTVDGCHQLEKNALHIWPRGNFMLIALPNIDGSFTCTLFLPFQGKSDAFERLQTDTQILDFFKKYFVDTIPLMPDLCAAFQENPTSSLVTIRCSPWHYQHRVVLMGDAAHAIVPFFGQGMNAGFEDCTILDSLADEYKDDWTQIIEVYNQTRIKDGNAIADLALQNFIEMRDLVADPKFLLRKKMETHLAARYPQEFLPVYSMVSFSHLPYSEALAEVHAQNRLFEQILKIENVEHTWQDNPTIDLIFQKWLREKKMGT